MRGESGSFQERGCSRAARSGRRGLATAVMNCDELEACCEKGMALKNEGDYEAAAGKFEAVLAEAPQHAKAHLGLGLVYCFTGEFEKSIEELKTAAVCSPDWEEAHLNLAKTFAMLGMYPEARVEFEKVLSLNPNHAEARKQLEYFAETGV